jgi:hypothetical protein
LSGKYALLSAEYVYFGDKAIPLPEPLKGVLHQNQGHRSALNAPHIPEFLKWWDDHSGRFAKERLRGVPQWDVFADVKSLGACAEAHTREAETDNRLDSARPS